MYQRYKDRVEFLAVYVREAHPVEGWRMRSNDVAGVIINQPKSRDERTDVASKCCSALEITMPMVVDEIDDRVGHAYSGMPDRLFVIDRQGKVVYKGGRGPFGFKVGEMEQSLAMLLLDQGAKTAQAPARFPALDNQAAWKRLPKATEGSGAKLPVWARTLADALPSTTAAMLELDYLHRAASPIEAKLRAKMRWVAAHANRCRYAQEHALADLRRAGAKKAAIAVLTGDRKNWPANERDALTFAHKLTLNASAVTDDEVAALIKKYGEKQVVAMVQLLAYANFQDRLLWTLGLESEGGGPLPPVKVRFARLDPKEAPTVPPRKVPAHNGEKSAAKVLDEDWRSIDFVGLQKQLSAQRERPGRIRVPTWDEVKKQLPPGTTLPPKPLRIKWSLVCAGYQPQLAFAWSACTRNFGQEAKQDRVFEESLFWVVTRSLDCFY